jgi:hypothetical protein
VGLVVVIVAIAGILLWMTNGGPKAFGEWFAD